MLVKPWSLSWAPSIGTTWERLWRAGKFGRSPWWTLNRNRTTNSGTSLWSQKLFGRFWACHPRKKCHGSWSWILKLLKHKTLISLFPLQENRKRSVSRQAGSVPQFLDNTGQILYFPMTPLPGKSGEENLNHRTTCSWFQGSRILPPGWEVDWDTDVLGVLCAV